METLDKITLKTKDGIIYNFKLIPTGWYLLENTPKSIRSTGNLKNPTSVELPGNIILETNRVYPLAGIPHKLKNIENFRNKLRFLFTTT